MLDEAHALKNANSQRSRRLRKLASGCRGRVMLTGGLRGQLDSKREIVPDMHSPSSSLVLCMLAVSFGSSRAILCR